jgi:hypothetical protein
MESNMKNFVRILFFSMVLTCCMAVVPAIVNAQWDRGPVVVYEQRDGRGNAQGFGVGEYRNDRGEFGQLRNDAAQSVSVPNGYRVRFCENEGRNGEGRCEELGPGDHNLRYQNMASYIKVTGPGGWNGWGNNNVGSRGVIVYGDRDFHGRSQEYGVGRYLYAGGQFGNMKNDDAGSVVVQKGFRVRFCENEGSDGRGSGKCEDYGEGSYNLRYNDTASYIEVQRVGGFGGGWGGNGGSNNGGNNGGFIGGNSVVVFSDRDQRGTQQPFGVGTFRNDFRQFGRLKNDDAGSVYVPRGYRIRLCAGEGGGVGEGPCEEWGPGLHNLQYNDQASYIRVWRGN